jgi:hypothetical protein
VYAQRRRQGAGIFSAALLVVTRPAVIDDVVQPGRQQQRWRRRRFNFKNCVEDRGNVIERVVMPASLTVPPEEIGEYLAGSVGDTIAE